MATTRRFFIESIEKEAVLTGDEYAHAKNVLRLKEGDEIVLLDGSGVEYDAIINRAEKGAMFCTVLNGRPSEKECKTPIALLIGALKGDKTELVVQKATELGVSRIGVFSSRFCSAYMNISFPCFTTPAVFSVRSLLRKDTLRWHCRFCFSWAP